MTLYQFKALDEEEQLEIVFSKSVQVAEREEGESSFVLYQLNSFYIELHLNNDSMKTRIRTFSNTDLLAPYLRDLNISFD